MSNIDFDLYLIADPDMVQRNLLDAVKRAIDGGVKAVQLRGKTLPAAELLKIGEKLRLLTDRKAVKFFINDRIDIAMALDADGIHLGQNSLPVSSAGRISGGRFIMGVSTHNLKEARNAEMRGADFITFGPVFATISKLAFGLPLGLGKLADVTKSVNIPVFAIGGIGADKVNSVKDTGGAYGVAVISAILNAESVYSATVNMCRELRYSKSDGRTIYT